MPTITDQAPAAPPPYLIHPAGADQLTPGRRVCIREKVNGLAAAFRFSAGSLISSVSAEAFLGRHDPAVEAKAAKACEAAVEAANLALLASHAGLAIYGVIVGATEPHIYGITSPTLIVTEAWRQGQGWLGGGEVEELCAVLGLEVAPGILMNVPWNEECLERSSGRSFLALEHERRDVLREGMTIQPMDGDPEGLVRVAVLNPLICPF